MDTEVNSLNISKKIKTEKEERIITSLREQYLINEYQIDQFDYQSYLNIHKILFEGVYPFAGNIRTCWLRKGYTSFVDPLKIKRKLSLLLLKMNVESNKISNHEDFITFVSNYFYEINLIHPFEEGNGRTERIYFKKFVEHLNTKLDFGEYQFNFERLDKEGKSSFNVAIMLKSIGKDDEWYDSMMEEIITYSSCKIKKR